MSNIDINDTDTLSPEEKQEAQILLHPWIFAEAYLQDPMDPTLPLKLRKYQRNALKDRHFRKLFRMGRRCVSAKDTIYTPDGAYRFEELIDRHPPIWTLDKDFKLVETYDYEVWDNGVVDTLTIITSTGKHQQVSLDHPFLIYTAYGPKWVEAQDLDITNQIAVPRQLFSSLSSEIGKDKATYLGYFLSNEHSAVTIPAVIYRATNPEIALFLKIYWANIGWTTNRIGVANRTKSIADGIRHLLLRLGISSSIIENPPDNTWLVNVTNSDAIEKFHTLILNLEDSPIDCSVPEQEDISWEPIHEIKHSGKQRTIDLHVPKTHCFVGADIISHNTGKTVLLAIEAVYKAFTYHNRKILIVTAYEGQLDEIFNDIDHLCFDSLKIKDSISRVTRKPHKVELLNGSSITGNVGNNSVRGKCLAEGSQVWMEDLSWKSIEDVQVGDMVVSWNQKTNVPEPKKVEAVHKNGVKPVYEISTRSGRFLRATENHRVFLNSGEEIKIRDLKGWETDQSDSHFITSIGIDVELSTLDGSRRQILRQQYARVSSIREVDSCQTYDLTIEENHNYIALYPPDEEFGPFKVNGISNGGLLVHNSANDLIIDECDYIPENILLEAIWPIATTTRDTTVILSSTPTGRHEFFYNVSKNQHKPEFNFHEFHIPSSESPEWTKEHEDLIRATTDELRYVREYEAEFGEATEGVFRNKYIEPSLYVYGYDTIELNDQPYITMGVDWNEAAAGVRVVLLEHVRHPMQLQPYNLGEPEKAPIVTRQNFLRMIASYTISAEDYTNTAAVDFILGLFSQFPVHHACFDRGHGHTNWELLRLAIQRGVSATGKNCAGMRHMLDKMSVIDFGGSSEIIDVTTNETTKVRTKNLLVRNAVKLLENGRYVIPAVDIIKGPSQEDVHVTIELEQTKLVGQMRDYSVLRRTDKGEIFSAGNDHTLDAFMLATHAFLLENDKFITWTYDTEAYVTRSPILEQTGFTRTPLTPSKIPDKPSLSIVGGIPVRDFGLYPKQGEPPEDDETDSFLGGSAKSGTRLSKGLRHTSRDSDF